MTGVPTGLTAFDRLTTGFQNSDLILIAARPSMGKPALAQNIVAHSAPGIRPANVSRSVTASAGPQARRWWRRGTCSTMAPSAGRCRT